MKRHQLLGGAVFLVLVTTRLAAGQVQVGGVISTTFRNAAVENISNLTFRNFSNFHTLRTRIFFDAEVTTDVYAFSQILVDTDEFQLYSAYVRVENLVGGALNLQAGILPTPVGSYVERAYMDKNPVIGTPLMYNYHSNLVPSRTGIYTADQLLAQRGNRTSHGLPVIYDACWNTGIEAFGALGSFDWSLSAVTGSVTKPTVEQQDKNPQATGRLVYNFRPGLVIGVHGYYGEYLWDGAYADTLPPGARISDYRNSGAGWQFYFAHRMLEIHSEGSLGMWNYPYIGRLSALAGYLEAKYKLFAGVYAAGRFGWFEPSKVNDSTGAQQPWDYPVRRYEFALGYKPYRHLLLKAVAQLNRYEINSGLDNDLYALQMVASF